VKRTTVKIPDELDARLRYAAVDRREAHHDACVALLSRHAGPLLVPALGITR